MKKISMIALTVILSLSLCACGRRNNQNSAPQPTTVAPTTTPATTAPATTAPTTEATIMPDIPDMETNIPDSTVNDNSTDGTTDTTQENARSRSSHYGK